MNRELTYHRQISPAVGGFAQEKTRDELPASLQEAVRDMLALRREAARKQAENDYEEIPLVV